MAKKIYIRGTDGGLYEIDEADLASHRMSEEDANAIRDRLHDNTALASGFHVLICGAGRSGDFFLDLSKIHDEEDEGHDG